MYDNSIAKIGALTNHLQRPEIQQALHKKKGVDIRVSASNDRKYFYFAKQYDSYFIRVALPYDIQTKSALQPDSGFFYFLIITYCAILLLINLVANKFGKSIQQLRDFALHPADSPIAFPKNELGEIGHKITENYNQLKESKNQIDIEREKLLQHVHNSQEGICFFSTENKPEFYNGLFIQYTNVIIAESNNKPTAIFSDSAFNLLQKFLKNPLEPYMEYKIKKQGKTFAVRVMLFENKSFEVILNDVTVQEKTLLLKQEMTSNVAHELKTPIAGISGYLETILSQKLEKQKQRYFVQRAFNQTKVLADIVQDMSLIAKMEEMESSYIMQSVNLSALLLKMKDDFSSLLMKNKVDLYLDIKDNLVLRGNQNLLYSIFKNLIDNSLRYAGEEIEIHIHSYKEDEEFHYFSFYDTGKGIAEESHLPRLFERFYRINEGRTRETGGTGLGLSIVKNAVLIHGGVIHVKNRKEGGLEFLFQFKK